VTQSLGIGGLLWTR